MSIVFESQKPMSVSVVFSNHKLMSNVHKNIHILFWLMSDVLLKKIFSLTLDVRCLKVFKHERPMSN